VNVYLVICLGSVDERFLDYLDGDGEMRLDTVRRLRLYTTALLDGSITPVAVAEDWADYYVLVTAFVAAYAPGWVGDSKGAAALLDGPENGDHAPLSEDDRTYLLALESVLDMYSERTTED
jgi:hypothetical protein